MSGDVLGYHRKILREGILREGAERWGGGRGKVCGGRGRGVSRRKEKERDR